MCFVYLQRREGLLYVIEALLIIIKAFHRGKELEME